MPFALGPLKLQHPTVLAPMEGVSGPLFRHRMAQYGGIGMVCTEFVRISHRPFLTKEAHKVVQKVPCVPLSVQVMGNNPALLADAAQKLVDAGADCIDINVGCPSRNATRAGVGASLLKNPLLLKEIAQRIRDVTPVLSAKIRAGDTSCDQSRQAVEILQRAGIDFLAVHPRRRVDAYRGQADWAITKSIVRQCDIPVIGNGDLWTAADAIDKMHHAGCAAVMFGRPALRNPFIFAEFATQLRASLTQSGASPHTVHAHSPQRLWEHIHKTITSYHGQMGEKALGPLKELSRWWVQGIEDHMSSPSEYHHIRRDLLRAQNCQALHAQWEYVLSSATPNSQAPTQQRHANHVATECVTI